MTTRRDALRLLAAAAAVLAVPEAAAAAPSDPDDLAVLRALLRSIYGDGAPEGCLAGWEELLGVVAPDRAELLRALPAVLDQGTRLLLPSIDTFRALAPEAQELALEDWATSPLGLRRQIYGALRKLLLFLAYTDPAAHAAIGYPGPLLGRVALPVFPPRFGVP